MVHMRPIHANTSHQFLISWPLMGMSDVDRYFIKLYNILVQHTKEYKAIE